ncbi:MAG: Glycerol-3-phosphate dehydrogenase 1, partial [Firmicutes bacterium]|nr:Glycerol-3-phosphate dehydrogenase 1 [Bacillota bacterium]
TTDTPYAEDPDLVTTEEDDIQYILDAANASFPGVQLQRSDVISSIAGLRPLLNAEGGTTASLSREHKLWESESGLISIAGGKLTTYRTMAAEATDHVVKRLGMTGRRCRTGELPLGADRPAALERLVREYPELGKPVVPGLPNLKAEVAYAAREEMAVYPQDFLERRTRIALLDRGHGEAQHAEVAELLARFGDKAAAAAEPEPRLPGTMQG